MKSTNNSFAIITPSYAPDFQRCQLLCQSIDNFIEPIVNHYIIVDRDDLSLFRQLQSHHRHVLTKESLLPWWFKRLPVAQNIWFSFKTVPVRGWLIQQIIKIAAAREIKEEVIVFVDSDVVFVRPFNLTNFVQNERVRLFREPIGNEIQRKIQYRWHQAASRLLALPEPSDRIPDYIGQIVTWRHDCAIELCNHLERVGGKSWLEILASSWHISEYILYGVFVERILQEQSAPQAHPREVHSLWSRTASLAHSRSQHYFDSKIICHDYWEPIFLSQQQLENFVLRIEPEQVAIMISAKAKMSPSYYQPIIDKVLNSAINSY